MRLKNILKKIPYISCISIIAKRKRIAVYLVGGVLRAVFLRKNKELLDFDFCVEKNTLELVKEFKRETRAKLIVLDEKQQSFRLIIKKYNKIYTYDFTCLRGFDLEGDLSRRDFTINTLAVDLTSLQEPKLLDLLGARTDLEKKCIRVISENVLEDDPLRILRAFSFSASLQFKIEKCTEKLLKKHRLLLENVSGERVNEEFFKILDSENSFKIIKKMSQLHIIDVVLPYVTQQRGVSQGPYHHLDVWEHSLETLLKFELLIRRKLSKNAEIASYLNRFITGKHKLIHILKLACLLHDAGKPFAKKEKDKKTIFHTHEKIGAEFMEDVYAKLKLSFKEKEILKKLIFWHLRPGYLADQERPSRRTVYRFFRDAGQEGVAVILLSLADWRATRGPLTDSRKRIRHEKVMLNLISYYFREREKRPLPRLIDGFDIMKRFKLNPSPLLGRILKRLKEEQALGKISTKREAYRLAEKVITKVEGRRKK